jgi:hypothetical protein
MSSKCHCRYRHRWSYRRPPCRHGRRAPSLLERYSFLRTYMPTYMHVVYVRGYAAISSSIERLPHLPAYLRNTVSTCRLLGCLAILLSCYTVLSALLFSLCAAVAWLL